MTAIRRKARRLVLSALGTALWCCPGDARALDSVDLQVGAKIGFGSNPFGVTPNPLGFGAGLCAGASFRGFYGGLSFVYWLGGTASNSALGSVTTGSGATGTPGSTTIHTYQAGVELGYGFRLPGGWFTLRPQVGLGDALFAAHAIGLQVGGGTVQSGSTVAGNFYFEPGVAILVSVGIVYFGADVSVLVLPGVGEDEGGNSTSTTEAGFTTHAQAGVHF
jgi:hypothetical protein